MALPDVIDEALRARGRPRRVLRPELRFREERSHRVWTPRLVRLAADLGVSPHRAPAALRAADRAQEEYEEALLAIGRRTLAWARAGRGPVVLVCGPLHVIHDPTVNAGIPGIIRGHGALALPVDCYPVPEGTSLLPAVEWGEANRSLRAALGARLEGDVYPLLLSSFGCGPASFGEHIFAALGEGHPHTALESDGHGGAAGYVTRVQAFLHAVRRHDRRPSAPAPERLRVLEPPPPRPIVEERDARLVVFPMGRRFASVLASAYRAVGLEAVPAPTPSAEGLAAARRDCSGKECLPYQMIWGSFRRAVEDARTADRRTVLLQIADVGACRTCLFPVKDRLTLERMGLDGRVDVRTFEVEKQAGPPLLGRIWGAVVAWDILNQLAAYLRPGERQPDEADRLYERACADLEAALARRVRREGYRSLLDLRDDLYPVLDRAAAAFAPLARRLEGRDDLRTVLVSGDVYVRVDELASDDLIRRLNALGLRVLLDPFTLLLEYLSFDRRHDLLADPGNALSRQAIWLAESGVRRLLYRRVQRAHPWMPTPDPAAVLDAALERQGRFPRGEGLVTVGSVISGWRQAEFDGVIVANPWGCGPGIASEGVLRGQTEISLLFVYLDGSPLDDRRLRSFAFNLLRRPARRARSPDGTTREQVTAADR